MQGSINSSELTNQDSIFDIIFENKPIDNLKKLIEENPKCLKQKHTKGFTPLGFACANKRCEVVELLIKNYNVDINEIYQVGFTSNKKSYTALNTAVKYDADTCLEVLLKNKANLDICKLNDELMPPLYQCFIEIINNDTSDKIINKCLPVLMRHNVNSNARNKNYLSASGYLELLKEPHNAYSYRIISNQIELARKINSEIQNKIDNDNSRSSVSSTSLRFSESYSKAHSTTKCNSCLIN